MKVQQTKLVGGLILLSLLMLPVTLAAQKKELNRNWKCAPISQVNVPGETISQVGFDISTWKPAVVPGTVLTTMLENGEVPDPFYGMNNEAIKDIYDTGRDYYTYWFLSDFSQSKETGEQVWLHLRGVNYSCDVFLNGQKVNAERHYGMYLRQTYNITQLIANNGVNRLAVIVYPVDPVGNPNGGQGGDGVIARNVSHQYVAGWDWIQPIRDRNTGIWDKVFIETTRAVNLQNPHVVTHVPGNRQPGAVQEPAIINVSAELVNTSSQKVRGRLVCEMGGQKVEKGITLDGHANVKIDLPELVFKNPKLWWPNGYGDQYLYALKMQFIAHDGQMSDEETVEVGIREIQHQWNAHTRSMEVRVNGQKIFIKGGNWIISDALLRFSPERYDAEVRYHRDMRLNLIRIWGGAITERPEFYAACNKYGLLVMQDFWISGDCNGRWFDPKKKEDQWTRRKYPDDHQLFIHSAVDMVKMIRNNPSLAIWCGGNELTPSKDILEALTDSVLPLWDGTRWFVEYSNSDSMSYNFLGGNGDGPYGIQPDSIFWQHRTFPFNSEVGSVGVGDYASLQRFVPEDILKTTNLNQRDIDPVWRYHKYIGYGHHVDAYGEVTSLEDFSRKAQLVNYNQYRALIEGFTSHMWDWYTGTIIWKTQNPWTALRGQMYDYYLDPNACLYGLRTAGELLHVMCNPETKMVMVANNGFGSEHDLMLVSRVYNMDGQESQSSQIISIGPSSTRNIMSVKKSLKQMGGEEQGAFLLLQLLNQDRAVISENFYWYPNENGQYSGLQRLPASKLEVSAKWSGENKVEVTLNNPQSAPVAFFNRLAVVDSRSHKRILPVFADDNYISVVPGSQKIIELECPQAKTTDWMISLEGWNFKPQYFKIESL